jgi:outer membrane biosynthesis protein TonB
MTKKTKKSKKATKNSKQTKVAAQPEEEPDTATASISVEAPQATPATPEADVTVESQQAVAAPAQSTAGTRSEAAKANIKQGLAAHKTAGRPSRESLTLVFGKAGYLMTWPQRAEKFGITPEKFQDALAKKIKETKV